MNHTLRGPGCAPWLSALLKTYVESFCRSQRELTLPGPRNGARTTVTGSFRFAPSELPRSTAVRVRRASSLPQAQRVFRCRIGSFAACSRCSPVNTVVACVAQQRPGRTAARPQRTSAHHRVPGRSFDWMARRPPAVRRHGRRDLTAGCSRAGTPAAPRCDYALSYKCAPLTVLSRGQWRPC